MFIVVYLISLGHDKNVLKLKLILKLKYYNTKCQYLQADPKNLQNLEMGFIKFLASHYYSLDSNEEKDISSLIRKTSWFLLHFDWQINICISRNSILYTNFPLLFFKDHIFLYTLDNFNKIYINYIILWKTCTCLNMISLTINKIMFNIVN